MNIRPFAAVAATAAMAGGLLLTGTSAASASNWSCPSGAACGYKTGSTKPSFKTWVDDDYLGRANKVKNNGQAGYYDKAVFYFGYWENDQQFYNRKCLSRGSQKFLRKNHNKTASVNEIKWVHSCP